MNTRIFKQIARGLRKKAPVIIMSFGIISAVGTGISAVAATKKAMDRISEHGEELEMKEKVKIAAPYFIAPVLSLGTTIGCFVGLNHIHNKRYQALMGSYVMLQQAYDISKNGAKGTFGLLASAGAAKAISEKDEGPKEEPLILCHDTLKDRWFRARYSDVVVAEYECNSFFQETGCCPLSYFYNELSQPIEDEDEIYGWDCEYIGYNWCKYWIEFRHEFINEEGKEPYMRIIFPMPVELESIQENGTVVAYDFDKR